MFAKAELHCLTPHFDFAFQRYFCLYICFSLFLLLSTRLCLSVLSFFVLLLLLLPSSLLFPHRLQRAKSYLSLLTHPFCTLANPKLCPITSLLNQRLYRWALRRMPIQFCTEIWTRERQRRVKQLASYWTDECFILKVYRAPCLVFWCVCVVCVLFLHVAVLVCVRPEFTSFPEVGCHVLSDAAYMSVLAWCQSTCAPPLFSCRVRQCRWEVQEGEKKKHR